MKVASLVAIGALAARAFQLLRGGGREFRALQGVVVNRPSHELFHFWRNFENLPQFMGFVDRVEIEDERLSSWGVRLPNGHAFQWKMETTEAIENERISWRTTADSKIELSVTVSFTEFPERRGTEVMQAIRCRLPEGASGRAFRRLIGRKPERQLRADLLRFKKLMEVGGVPSKRRVG
jgi:uncharacterized membrane protein